MPSSVIRSYSYDEGAQRLDMLFVSGRRYSYSGVPRAIADGLAAAASQGHYFNTHIRDHYPFDRRYAVRERRGPLGD